MTTILQPIFTRYLYEFHQVKHSLQQSILNKQREDALFWAYELYHSGFKEEVWNQAINIYLDYFLEKNPTFKSRLKKFHKEWQNTGNDCLIGTVIGTLSVWNGREDDNPENTFKPKQFIILYKDDRHVTMSMTCLARKYLKHVSNCSISIASQRAAEEIDGLSTERIREAYLGTNWLYYCAATPIWASRIQEGRGRISGEKIIFETDDLLEEFFEKWGYEPDEQSMEMHKMHGIYSLS